MSYLQYSTAFLFPIHKSFDIQKTQNNNNNSQVLHSTSLLSVTNFPTAVIKYHEQGNLQNERLIWAYSTREIRISITRK